MSEITQKERERIIKELKEDSEKDSICTIRNILFNRKGRCSSEMSCQECHKKIREKLLDLIELAPTEKSMSAIEFADKLEYERKEDPCNIFKIIENALGLPSTMTAQDDIKALIDAIRNIDTSKSFGSIILQPSDADGIDINFNDIVYYNNEDTELKVIGFKFVEDNELYAIVCYKQNKYGYFDGLCEYPLNKLSHKKPRTFDDIIEDMKEASYEERILLAEEAYEMGRSAGNEKAEKI